MAVNAKPSSLFQHHAVLFEEASQFAFFEHFADDVAAADEFAFDVELRNCWPVGELFDAVAQLVALKYIVCFEGNADVIEDLGYLAGKTALGKIGRAFHKQYHVIVFYFGANPVLSCICHSFTCSLFNKEVYIVKWYVGPTGAKVNLSVRRSGFQCQCVQCGAHVALQTGVDHLVLFDLAQAFKGR